jgi:hypothetical protein
MAEPKLEERASVFPIQKYSLQYLKRHVELGVYLQEVGFLLGSRIYIHLRDNSCSRNSVAGGVVQVVEPSKHKAQSSNPSIIPLSPQKRKK